MVAGETDAAALAELDKGRLRNKLPELERALTERVGAHQRFLVAAQLAHVDFLGGHRPRAVSGRVHSGVPLISAAVSLP